MKKRIFAVCLFCLLLVSAVLLVSCKEQTGTDPGNSGGNPDQTGEHTHTFADTWSYDATYHWHAATCGHSDAVSGKAAHVFDADFVCGTCSFHGGELSGTKILAPGFTAEGTSYSLTVPNATEIYTFLDAIYTAEGADFAVYKDLECSVPILSKRTTLAPGDNVFYVLVTNGKQMEQYIFTVRRRLMYTVSFEVNGSEVLSQSVEEGSCAGQPDAPTPKGYTFTGWLFDFSTPITGDITVTAGLEANTYLITFEPTGGTLAMETMSVTFGERVTLPVPTNDSAAFCGWYEGDRQIRDGKWEIDRNIKVKAEWTSYFEISSDGTIMGLSTDGVQRTGAFVIPGEINGISVRSIGQGVFRQKQNITGITLPDSVTSIAGEAFYGCENLKNVRFGTGIKTIGVRAFYGCEALRELTLPEGLETIGVSAFRGCYGIWELKIPNSVTRIEDYAFAECVGLLRVRIGTGLTDLSAKSFSQCGKLIEVYDLSGIYKTTCGQGQVFHTSDSEESVLYTDANGYVFYQNADYYLIAYIGRETELTLPANCKGQRYALNDHAFYRRTDLTKVTVPDGSIRAIEKGTFEGCSNLKSVVLGGVGVIGTEAFKGCEKLESITVSTKMWLIGREAFFSCNNLKTISYQGTMAQWRSITLAEDWNVGGSYGQTLSLTVSCTDGDIRY